MGFTNTFACVAFGIHILFMIGVGVVKGVWNIDLAFLLGYSLPLTTTILGFTIGKSAVENAVSRYKNGTTNTTNNTTSTTGGVG